MPNAAASRTCAQAREARMRAFEGTHPTLRQSPPSRCFSTRATRAPRPAAPAAVTRPAVPAPITTRLYRPAGSGLTQSEGCTLWTSARLNSSSGWIMTRMKPFSWSLLKEARRTGTPAVDNPAPMYHASGRHEEDADGTGVAPVGSLVWHAGDRVARLGGRYNHPTAQLFGLRGLGNRRGLVLLDGVPLNDGFGGWINWGRVPDTIERVEVVPGGSSNLYGTWAMGGVVQILTEQPGPGEHVRAESRAGNLNTYTESLSGRYGTDRIGLSLGYRWFHTNGFITVPAYQRGPVDRTDDSRHENFAGTLRIAPDASTTITVGGNLFREDRTFGTALSVAARTIGSVTLGLEHELGGAGRR